jgi:hypothetical protein
MRASGKFIAGIVEVDDFFQALKVAVVHIGLDEIGTRPLVNIPQGRDLKLAVELRSEPRPIRVWIELWIPEKNDEIRVIRLSILPFVLFPPVMSFTQDDSLACHWLIGRILHLVGRLRELN